MRRVLWLCNIIIPEFSNVFRVKKNPVGGWISGMFQALADCKEYNMAIIFPIRDKGRMQDGLYEGISYYSIFDDVTHSIEPKEERIKRFEEILSEYNPDLIHIWGTEFVWARELVEACIHKGVEKRIIVSIQGLVSVYSRYFEIGIPSEYLIGEDNSIIRGKELFENKGVHETYVLKRIKCFFGRTDWDYSQVMAVNKNANYMRCGCVLRNVFYCYQSSWKYEKCSPYTIFISQASYPIKGFHIFVQALAIIVERFPQTRVRVSGTNLNNECDAYATFVKKLIEKSHVEPNIQFIGFQQENKMIDEYINANVFVSASLVENESNSVLEAMMVGTPVVSSYVGGIPTYMSHMDNGLMYPSTSYEMLAQMILRLFENAELCTEISASEVTTAKEFVSKEKGITDLLMGYDKVLRMEGI